MLTAGVCVSVFEALASCVLLPVWWPCGCLLLPAFEALASCVLLPAFEALAELTL